MKKIIIALISLLGAAGLCVGGFFFYQYKGNEVYSREGKFEYCTGLTVDFDKDGFSFLKPAFISSDESVLTVDKNGIITTQAPGTASVTAKGVNFECTTEITVLEHTGYIANCDEPYACDRCGNSVSVAGGHKLTELTCEDDSVCTVCSFVAVKAAGHDYAAADCENPEICKVCGGTKGAPLGHKWVPATCTEAEFCEVCEKTGEAALSHDMAPATCTEDSFCLICDAPGEEKALGHTVVEATCTKGSYCSVCKTALSKPLEHLYVPAGDGSEICAYCGTKKQVSTAPSGNMAEYVNEVLRLVNVERAAVGLGSLSLDSALCSVADVRAVEIITKFDHTRPNGTRCFTAMDEAGYSHSAAGENIAYNYPSPESVMNGWMNSSGHKANILSASFGRLGVGIAKDARGSLYWVQMFSN